MNVNTKEYWDFRFGSCNWEQSRGREQTIIFARAILPYLSIEPDFSGTILDFGCGAGDAIPIYHQVFPKAKLLGIDISEYAIKKCIERYADIASFAVGIVDDAPKADVIISSNVFEHLTEPVSAAKTLIGRCKDLYIAVPYREQPPLELEHIHSFDEHTFDSVGTTQYFIYPCQRWSEQGWKLWYHIRLKNIARQLVGKKLLSQKQQILFHITASSGLLH